MSTKATEVHYENVDPVGRLRLDPVLPGDIAAVTRNGNVTRLSPDKLDLDDAQQAFDQKNEAARDWEIFEKDRRQQQDKHEEDLGYRERPGDRERQRERD